MFMKFSKQLLNVFIITFVNLKTLINLVILKTLKAVKITKNSPFM